MWVTTACGSVTSSTTTTEPVAARRAAEPPSTGVEATAAALAPVALWRSTADASFDETLAAVEEAVADAGLMVLAEIDQAQGLATVGLDLDGTRALFVGSPEAGKDVFATNPAAGVVLPLRVYVWADGDETHVGYLDPVPMLAAVDRQLVDDASAVAAEARQIVTQATGSPPQPQAPR